MDNSMTTARLFTGAPIIAAVALMGVFSVLKSDRLSLSLTPAMAASHMSITRGATERLAVALAANQSATHRFVHFEIYNAAGRRVWQAWRSPVTVLYGVSRIVTSTWPVSHTLTPGQYTLTTTVVAPTGKPEASSQIVSISVG